MLPRAVGEKITTAADKAAATRKEMTDRAMAHQLNYNFIDGFAIVLFVNMKKVNLFFLIEYFQCENFDNMTRKFFIHNLTIFTCNSKL